MKNIIIISTIILLSLCYQASAQTEQGRILAGGSANISLSFNQGGTNAFVGMFPRVGYFVADDFAIGGSLPVSLNTVNDIWGFSLGIMPFVRYYFKDLDNAKLFAHAGIGYAISSIIVNNGTNTNSSLNTNIAGGVAWFLNNHVALEATLNFNVNSIGTETTTPNLAMGLGFQIHLGQGDE